MPRKRGTDRDRDQGIGYAFETAVFEINYAKSADIKTYLNDLITPGVGQLIIDERAPRPLSRTCPSG